MRNILYHEDLYWMHKSKCNFFVEWTYRYTIDSQCDSQSCRHSAIPGFVWYNSCGMEKKTTLNHEWENGLWRALLPTTGNPVALWVALSDFMYHLVVAWCYQILSWATWFQLGYQPKVHKQGKKISFGTMISSHGHYLTTSVTTISILAWFNGTLLDCFTID